MHATTKDTGGQFTLMEQLMPEGPQAPPHLHEAQREGFYILEGRARFTIDDRRIDARPGDFLTVPETTWHAFETLTEVRLLNWSHPPALSESLSRQECRLRAGRFRRKACRRPI